MSGKVKDHLSAAEIPAELVNGVTAVASRHQPYTQHGAGLIPERLLS